MSDNKVVLITEQSSSYEKINKNNDLYLKAVLAVLGKLNNNNRIYEEKEYVPQVEFLKNKIRNRGAIAGELNHPADRFDVDMNNVSHGLTEISYNPSNKTVSGVIKIFNTPKGQIARALLEGGLKLHISSRAAGTVSKIDNTVKLHRIFTYDIVNDPGFDEACLEAITESLGNDAALKYKEILKNSNKNINILNESLNLVKNDNIYIYDWSDRMTESELITLIDSEKEHFDTIEKNKLKMNQDNEQKVNEKSDVDFISKEEVANMYNHIKENVTSLEETINLINEKITNITPTDNDESSKPLLEDIQQLKDWTSGIAKHTEALIEHNNTMYEAFNEQEKEIKKHDSILRKLIPYVDSISESHKKMLVVTADELANVKNHNDVVLEQLEDFYSSYTSLIKEYNDLKQYTEFSFKQNAELFKLTEKLSLDNKNIIKEFVSFVEHVDSQNKVTNENFTEQKKLVNSLKEDLNNYQLSESFKVDSNLKDNVDAILNSIKKENIEVNKIITESEESKFIKFLDNETKNRFLDLPIDKKEKVISTVNENHWFNAKDLKLVVESAINDTNEPTETKEPLWLAYCPNDIRPIYESMSDVDKNIIKRQAENNYSLNSPATIKNFWNTRPLILATINEQLSKEHIGGQINESKSTEKNKVVNVAEWYEKRLQNRK